MKAKVTLRYDDASRSGFIEFIFDPPPAQALLITLEVEQANGRRWRSEASLDDTFNGRLFFNSYYLDDGECRITLKARESALEPETTLVTRSICLCNGDSLLSSRLRQAFRERPECALVVNNLDSSYFSWLSEELRHTNYPQLQRHEQPALRQLTRQQVDSFDQQGFLRLPSFFDPQLIASAADYLRTISDQGLYGFEKGSSERIVNLHERHAALRDLYFSARLYDAVSDLFGYQAYPCQSLTFINGSAQDAHQDTIHLTPFPRGLMCGIWIALEDVQPGSGELFFYPGSHPLPAVLCATHGVPKVDPAVGDYTDFGAVFTPAINALLADNPQLRPSKFIAKAGDVLIWQENLIHGGSLRADREKTRMSMVIHAFAEPALVYYDSTGMSGRRQTSLQH